MPACPKPPKPIKDAKRVARIKSLPCICCILDGIAAVGPSALHHCIVGRGGGGRCDYHALPLCYRHHQGKDGIHTREAWWIDRYGRDYDLVKDVNAMLDGFAP